MDLITILFVTGAVLGVLLLVLAIVAVVVLLPPVRRAMADRVAATSEHPEHPEPDDGAERP